jgi:hypothetical protein
MSLIANINRMLAARNKSWISPLFLLAVALGTLTMKSAPEEREAFIYTLF